MLDETKYNAPPRPRTPIDLMIRKGLDMLPSTNFEWEDIVRLRFNSLKILDSLGINSNILYKAQSDARWILTNRPSPEEVHAVEVKFNNDRPPLAVIYNDSPATSFPRPLAEIFVQAGIDHIMGHLILGVSGMDREDENKACLIQYMASLTRAKEGSKTFGAFALSMIPGLKVHKHIPINNFKQPAQYQLIAAINQGA